MIVNQFGQPLIEATRNRPNRPRAISRPVDFDRSVSEFDHATLIGKSRKLFSNNGIIRSAIFSKSMFAVGNAWLPNALTQDKEWKATAEDYLSKWYRVCDVSGAFDFQSLLYQVSVAVDRDGDCGILFTNEGYPQIQLVPAHRIGVRAGETEVKSGRFKGKRIVKGCILNHYGRAIGYRVLGDAPDEDRDISAEDMILAADRDYFESVRGTPIFSFALNSFEDMDEANRRELTAMLISSSIAFVENNDFSALDPDNPTMDFSGASERPPTEMLGEGTIYRPGPNGKIEAITSSRPSPDYRAFHDRLINHALAGINWPRAMVESVDSTGTVTRLQLQIANDSVKDRQNLLTPIAQRLVVWAISKAIKAGTLPFSEDFYKWTFSKPQTLISIDAGRDAASLRENLKSGVTSWTEYAEGKGKTLENHFRELINERILFERLKTEAGANFDIFPN